MSGHRNHRPGLLLFVPETEAYVFALYLCTLVLEVVVAACKRELGDEAREDHRMFRGQSLYRNTV